MTACGGSHDSHRRYRVENRVEYRVENRVEYRAKKNVNQGYEYRVEIRRVQRRVVQSQPLILVYLLFLNALRGCIHMCLIAGGVHP